MSENKDKLVEKRSSEGKGDRMRDERGGESRTERWKRGEGRGSSLKGSTMAQAAFPEDLNHLSLELSLAHNTCA